MAISMDVGGIMDVGITYFADVHVSVLQESKNDHDTATVTTTELIDLRVALL